MPCDIPVGSPVTVALNVASGAWLDTGVVVGPEECLRITAVGTTVKFGVNADQCAYAEGWYSAAADPCAAPGYDPTAVYSLHTGEPPSFVTLEQPPYCLIAKLADSQPGGTHLTGTLRPNRATLFPAEALGGGGRVWLNFNDNVFEDNTGSFSVTLQRFATTPPYWMIETGGDTGAPQGVRLSPMTHQVYQALTVLYPLGYAPGADLSAQPTPFHIDFTSVRVRGPYRAYLTGSILTVCNDSGELAAGTPLDGVDLLRIGT